MYEIDKNKRYNVNYMTVGGSSHSLQNVSLKIVERDFVVLIDEEGKEHILTGPVGIHICEI